MEYLIKFAEIIAPILIALIGIIPTIKKSNKEVVERLEKTDKEMKGRIDDLETKVDAAEKKREFDNMKSCRIRILRFYDEICAGVHHSEGHFDDIIDDINEYETFCSRHEDFKNNKGKSAMAGIKRTYDELKAKGAFLNNDN